MKKTLLGIFISGLIITNPVLAFSDVSEDFWAYDRINEMYNRGIISGFEDGTFKPQAPITREQAATILSNFFKISAKSSANKFVDVAEEYWSNQYINAVGGYMPVTEISGNTYFRPFDAITRVEIAETISKILELGGEIDNKILDNFKDKDNFSENDKKYISLVVSNKLMVGDDKGNFRPSDTMTRAEFCALLDNASVYVKDDTKEDMGVQEEYVVSINGQKVSVDEFDLYFSIQQKAYEAMLGANIWKEKIEGVSVYDIVKDEAKEGVILNSIKLQKAAVLGIKLTEEEKSKLEEYADSDEGKQVCEFYKITKEQLCKINSEGLIMDKLMEKMYEIQDHSGHNHIDINKPITTILYDARHILLTTTDMSEEEKLQVKESALSLLDRVKNGEDFATLAMQYSEDPGSKDNGGLYENVGLGEFVLEFENAALSIEDGVIYPELVETSYGYHIIKLERKHEEVIELTIEEKQEIMQSHLDSLAQEWKEEATIEVNEEIYKAI